MRKAIKMAQASTLQNSCLEQHAQGGMAAETIIINDRVINPKPVFGLPYNPKLKARARELRYARNLPEVLFWLQVHKRKFHQMDFDRQRVVGNYIVDFYCKQLGLVIEIDGASHDFDGDYDARREQYLMAQGLKIYRIPVNDVLKNMEFVLMGLENYIVENYS